MYGAYPNPVMRVGLLEVDHMVDFKVNLAQKKIDHLAAFR